MIKKLSVVACMFVAGSALAQDPFGRVISVDGVATATTGATGTVVVPGMPVLDGTRIVTNAGARVTVRLDNGCIVNLGPSAGITLREDYTCEQLAASIVPLGASAATITPGTQAAVLTRVGPSPVPFGAGLIGLGGVGTLAAIAAIDDNNPFRDEDDDGEPISPN